MGEGVWAQIVCDTALMCSGWAVGPAGGRGQWRDLGGTCLLGAVAHVIAGVALGEEVGTGVEAPDTMRDGRQEGDPCTSQSPGGAENKGDATTVAHFSKIPK